MVRLTIVAGTACVIVAGGLTTAAGTAQTASSPADAGRRIYARLKCATCHQIDGRGNGRYPLDGVAARVPADGLRRWLTDAASMEAALPRLPALRMSTMKYRLNTEDLDALVAYLQTLK